MVAASTTFAEGMEVQLSDGYSQGAWGQCGMFGLFWSEICCDILSPKGMEVNLYLPSGEVT